MGDEMKLPDKEQKALEKDVAEAVENGKLKNQLKTAQDRVSMLEAGLELKTTTTQKIIKVDQDSLEIGAQATGRVKVYGNFNKPNEFSLKVKKAFELLTGAQEAAKKLNGGE